LNKSRPPAESGGEKPGAGPGEAGSAAAEKGSRNAPERKDPEAAGPEATASSNRGGGNETAAAGGRPGARADVGAPQVLAKDNTSEVPAKGDPTKGAAPADAPGAAAPAAGEAVIARREPGQVTVDKEIAAAASPEPHLELAARPSMETAAVETEGLKSAGRAGKSNLLPREIRELSGVGEALNLMVSAIDRSEDKIIEVGKDERSGRWNGLSLDLGLVTISYNRPEKKGNN
ncbi:MAG TPA: hypothetical protein VD772_12775, partial [Anseongella sp.]|nr:hypothetical protein [Anseongella sp.]